MDGTRRLLESASNEMSSCHDRAMVLSADSGDVFRHTVSNRATHEMAGDPGRVEREIGFGMRVMTMNRAWNVTNSLLGLAVALLVGLVGLVGCGNPADGVEEAEVSAASKEPMAAVEGAKAYAINAESSTIEFEGSKVTGSHSGGFKSFQGTISVADGKIVPPSEIEIDMASTWSDSDRLTGHLKNADFFDVPSYPTSKFVLTSIEAGTENHTVTGDLTLHGVTKSISFPAEVSVSDSQVGLKAEFFIMRFDFDIVYKGKVDDLIRDEVVIRLDVTADAA